MKRAVKNQLKYRKKDRNTVIRKCFKKECVKNCYFPWFDIAIEVINANDIEPVTFVVTLRKLIVKRRGILETIFIVVLGYCAKSSFCNLCKAFLIHSATPLTISILS